MAGYPDEIFMPDESITRAEVTVMFSRLITEKMDSNKDYSSSFLMCQRIAGMHLD